MTNNKPSNGMAPGLPILPGALLLMILLGLCGSCSSGMDSEDVATALEDRLTDALDFENGTKHEGSPPKGSSDSDAPQIREVRGEEDWRLGADFSIDLVSDFPEPEKVKRAIIHVIGAKSYIVVDPSFLVKTIMGLSGTLKDDKDIRNKLFQMEFAMQTVDDQTGGYKSMSLNIKDEDAQDVGHPIETVEVDNQGELNESGRPEGSTSESAPQITQLDGPAELYPGEEFRVYLYTDFEETAEIVAAILTTPGNQGYYEIEGSVKSHAGEMAMIIQGHLSTLGFAVGDTLTFLYALKSSSDQVGVYRSWTLNVVEKPSDTDGDDSDGDQEPPPTGRQLGPMRLYPFSISKDGNKSIRQSIGPWADKINNR